MVDSIRIDDLLKEINFDSLDDLLKRLSLSAKRSTSTKIDKDSLLGNIQSLQALVAAAGALRRSISNLQMSYMAPTYITSSIMTTPDSTMGYYRSTNITAEFSCKDNLDQALISWLFGYLKPGPTGTASSDSVLSSVSGGSATTSDTKTKVVYGGGLSSKIPSDDSTDI